MISVAMATYNGSKYIREQIESILRQTVQDFELNICDDCSTDDTWEIIKEYAEQDERIKIMRNEQNIGYRRNFEKIVFLCQGDFIAFCDQDDIWLPMHLEILYNNIGDFDACSADAELIDAEGHYLHRRLSDFTQLKSWTENPLDQAYTFFFYRNPFPGCNTMYKKSFLFRALPINCNAIQLHDTWADAFSCVCGRGVNYVNAITMYYRFHAESVTAASKKDDKQSPLRYMLRKFISGTSSCNFRYVKDRKQYCEEIFERNIDLNEEQLRFLNQAYKYHVRRATFWGRLQNLYFDIIHFKKIYNI